MSRWRSHTESRINLILLNLSGNPRDPFKSRFFYPPKSGGYRTRTCKGLLPLVFETSALAILPTLRFVAGETTLTPLHYPYHTKNAPQTGHFYYAHYLVFYRNTVLFNNNFMPIVVIVNILDNHSAHGSGKKCR